MPRRSSAVHQAPPPAPVVSGGSIGRIGSTIAEGMAFGTGSVIAHRAVDAVVGPRTIQHVTVVSKAAAAVPAGPMGNAVATDACGVHSKAFQDCINNFGSDISKRQFYLDMLNECRQGSGRSASRPAPRPAPMRNPPQPVHQAPPPAPVRSGESILGGIGLTIAQGMAFGTGSAIAHRAVDAVVGPRTIQHETVVSEAAVATDACGVHSKAFQDCINNFGSNISKCQFYLDMLNECRQVHQAPPPAPVLSDGSILGEIGSTIAQGISFGTGTGNAVAHKAVDAVVGPRTIQHKTVVSEAAVPAAPMGNAVATDACGVYSKAFQDCFNNFGSDISKCQFYLDMLNECRQGSGASFNA